MGWSCRADASEVLDRAQRLCVAQTGKSNEFRTARGAFFFDVSSREHRDGAITGTIFRLLPGNMARKAGSFRIEPSGEVSRGPKVMQTAAQHYREYCDGMRHAEAAKRGARITFTLID